MRAGLAHIGRNGHADFETVLAGVRPSSLAFYAAESRQGSDQYKNTHHEAAIAKRDSYE